METTIKKIKIDNIIYNADVDFRTVIKCNDIATDKTIDDYERTLGIICTMFGEEALDHSEHYNKLLNWCLDYISCGQKVDTNKKPDMNYTKDMPYIEASFMYDYKMWLPDIKMNWQDFAHLLNGLSSGDNGCILNKVRFGRTYDASKIKDPKERQEFIEWQKSIALEEEKPKREFTSEEKNNMEEFNKLMGL